MSLTALGPTEIASRLYRHQRIHRALPHPDAVTDGHVEQYRRDGFLAVENVFTADEVASYLAGLHRLIGGGVPEFEDIEFEEAMPKDRPLSPEDREPYVRKLMWFCAYDQRLQSMADHPMLHRIMPRLIGAKLNLLQEMALLKPPHVGREKPWHQDSAYFAWSPPEQVIGTWTALDAATPENGCMHVIPGSHLAGPKPHYHDRDCQLPDEVVEVERDVVVPLKPGGVLFFSALIHHGTPPNTSAARRRAIQLHYASEHCRRIRGDEHEAMFHDAHGYAGCSSVDGRRRRPIVSRPENI